jgi:hypothetical protein
MQAALLSDGVRESDGLLAGLAIVLTRPGLVAASACLRVVYAFLQHAAGVWRYAWGEGPREHQRSPLPASCGLVWQVGLQLTQQLLCCNSYFSKVGQSQRLSAVAGIVLIQGLGLCLQESCWLPGKGQWLMAGRCNVRSRQSLGRWGRCGCPGVGGQQAGVAGVGWAHWHMRSASWTLTPDVAASVQQPAEH